MSLHIYLEKKESGTQVKVCRDVENLSQPTIHKTYKYTWLSNE